MAEIKNSFLRSKMNKDLDDRLIPNGEYRDALNISVGKSESDDIGSLENILGNTLITNFGFTGLQVMGYYADEANSRFFVFLTDSAQTRLDLPNPSTGTGSNCHICTWSLATGPVTLVSGYFLNFSTAFPMTGVSLVENLLFFTDNRNQPRKINVNKSLGYYTKENHISVAKYNPYTPISLLKRIKTTAISNAANPLNSTDTTTTAAVASTLIEGDNIIIGRNDALTAYGAGVIKIQFLDGTTVATSGTGDAFLNSIGTASGPVGQTFQTYTADVNTTIPINTQFKFVAPIDLTKIIVADAAGIEVGMQVVSISSVGTEKIKANQFVFVTAISGTTISLSSSGVVALNDILYFLISTMTNKADEENWPGDPDYLEDKFIRLSYRFQFDDGEYSIIAPFTQIAYIPKQKGYYINGDEEAAYRSTILSWMENKIDNIIAQIEFPDLLSNCTPTDSSNYKISNLEILYKESDGIAIKVLDDINFADAVGGWENTSTTNIYSYNYQSRKPYKTLPTGQTTRVYDKVPTRALTQEIAGNRVIYANYRDKYTPPSSLGYEVAVTEKQDNGLSDSWIEYPNHSLKQNRNYQVGFILADKFGRQSDVILSNINTTTSVLGNITYRGSTIYSPYNSSTLESVVKDWFGDALAVVVRNSIQSGLNNSPNSNFTEPGLYAIPLNNDAQGFNIAGNSTTFPTTKQYRFTLNTTVNTGQNIPLEGSYLRGEFVDYVEVTSVVAPVGAITYYEITCNGDINQDFYSSTIPAITPDPKFAYTINERGWYSYKVVVKQQEQDYYNVYLPGILNGYPQQPDRVIVTGQTTSTAINDVNLSITPGSVKIGAGQEISGIGISGVPTIVQANPAGSVVNFIMSSAQVLPTVGTALTFTQPVDYGLFPINEDGKTANIVLINDNINKIPRDLTEVGPDQKQFRSSVQLYGRVQNTATGNVQYFPETNTDTAVSISTANDSGMTTDSLNAIGQANLYQFDSNPLIARMSTNNNIGVTSETMIPHLAIYETDPIDSVLDIFWESTTVGLISDLNSDVVTDSVGPAQTSSFTLALNESYQAGTAVSTEFTVQTVAGVNLNNMSGVLTCTDLNGDPQNSVFDLILQSNTAGQGSKFKIFLVSSLVFNYESPQTNVYNISMTFTDSDGVSTPPVSRGISLVNIKPTITTAVANVIPTITLQQNFIGNIVKSDGTNIIKAVNGTALTASVTSEIKYTAISTNSGMTYFEVAPLTGVLSRTSVAIPLGTYVLTVTAQDAWNEATNLFAVGAGLTTSSLKSDTATLTIIVGTTPVNDGVTGPCIDSSNVFMSAGTYRTTEQTNSPPNNIDGCWYLSSSTLTRNNLPDPWINASNISTQTGAPGLNGNAVRLGGANGFSAKALEKGTVVFTFNLCQKYNSTQTSGLTNLEASLNSLRIYHKATGAPQTAWVIATDINGRNISGPDLGGYLISNSTINTSKYLQLVFAFDTPGEYAIIASNLGTYETSSPPDQFSQPQMWVTSNDLNFTNCVIVPDSNLGGVPGAGTNYASTATPKSYRYYINPTPSNTFTCGSTATASGNNYAQVPYPEYVTQFYDSAALTQVLTPSNWTTTDSFYNFNVFTFSMPASVGLMPEYSIYKFSTQLTNDSTFKIGSIVDQTGAPNVLNCNPPSSGNGPYSKPTVRSNDSNYR